MTYAQNGTIAITNLIYPLSTDSTIGLFPQDAKPMEFSGHVWELKSIWEQQPRGK